MSPAQRSSIPIVVGVLMIVFASIGLLTTAVNLYAASRDDLVTGFPTVAKLAIMLGILDAFVGLMQLGAGIACVRYRRNAPERAFSYAIARMVLTLGGVVAAMMVMHPALGRHASALTTGYVVVLSMITWPIIVIALMTRPSAKASCTI